MNMHTIGSSFRWDSLAQMNRPASQEKLAEEVQRLHATGLTAQDISVALHIPLPTVLEWLAV